ncbi:DUF4199 domain-containing protein [Larkinella soli]|uniref:DUF4199 domain-containing protein n=1 Tax=Larkinella soli TaxID=1770527 RepID=UPI000FFC17DB|nr:DUF4199 domain-containing protein [Larkinella soli]
MKRNVLVFGLISGAILATFMVVTTLMCYKNENFEDNAVLGYGAMILAFSFIFVAIKNYRDRYNSGVISFGQAFKIGLFVTLITSTIYVLIWLIEFYLFIPDFMDKYTAHVMRELRESGAGPAELESKAAEMANFGEMYKNPVLVVLFTYAEVFPIGLVISLLCALILKRNSGGQAQLTGS